MTRELLRLSQIWVLVLLSRLCICLAALHKVPVVSRVPAVTSRIPVTVTGGGASPKYRKGRIFSLLYACACMMRNISQ